MSDLTEIHRSLGRVEGKLDAALERMDGHEAAIAKHREEIDALKGSHRWAAGWAAGISLVAGAALTWAANALGIGGTHGLKP